MPLCWKSCWADLAALPPLAADPSAAAQTGVADFYSGWPSLSLWFKSEAMVDRYLPVLNAFAPALQLHCRQISCWKLFTAGDILMRVGYCKVYRSCFRTLGAKVLEIFVLMIRHFHRKERKFLERLLPRNESSTGANVPRNESSWNIRSWGTKVPQERMFHGTKVPRERKFSLWSFRSWERKCRGTKRPGIFQAQGQGQRQMTRLIVSRVWSIQWFCSQWPWLILEVDFKVTV